MWRKELLAQECPQTVCQSLRVSKFQLFAPYRLCCIVPTLFLATNHTLSQTITATIPITTEVWQTLMAQMNKVNQAKTNA